jgi:hypothetical protein
MLTSALPSRQAFAQSCEIPPGGQMIAGADPGVRLSYRLEPAALQTDRHFSVRVDACGIPDDATLVIDAQMPEHRHGMNYKPVVTRVGPGAWRADGLLLHMPGRWEFRFELRAGERVERLAHTVVVQ